MSQILEWEDLSEAERQAIKVLSERSFLAFNRIFFQLLQGEKWSVNWHHRYIAQVIEDIVDGKRRNVVFNVPPGSGKTEMLSIHAPVWTMLNCQKVRNLNISFSDTLTKRNSRRSREIITSAEFQTLWPHSLGVNQADEWQLLNDDGKVKAEVVSRAASGQITGSRGGYQMPGFSGWINLDDFDKPLDVFSEVKRKKAQQTLTNTIRSRRANKSKENPTPIVAIQQRLHTDDSSAFMLSGAMGIDFEHVIIPALIDEAYIESLPEWLQEHCWNDVKDSEKMRGYWSYWPANEYVGDLCRQWDTDEYTFMSQGMQKPIKLGGNVFDGSWWQTYGPDGDKPEPERFEYRFTTADTAQKTANHNDWSVLCEWGVYKYDLYLIHMERGKWKAPELETNFKAFIAQAWRKNREAGTLRKIYVEDKSSGTALIQNLEKKLPIKITALQRNKDKVTRAMDVLPVVKAQRVYLPAEASFSSEFIAEHSAFTYDDTHDHDDIVDNLIDAVTEELLLGSDALRRLKALAS